MSPLEMSEKVRLSAAACHRQIFEFPWHRKPAQYQTYSFAEHLGSKGLQRDSAMPTLRPVFGEHQIALQEGCHSAQIQDHIDRIVRYILPGILDIGPDAVHVIFSRHIIEDIVYFLPVQRLRFVDNFNPINCLCGKLVWHRSSVCV